MFNFLRYRLFKIFFSPIIIFTDDLYIVSMNNIFYNTKYKKKFKNNNKKIQLHSFIPVINHDIDEIKKYIKSDKKNIKYFNYNEHGYFLKLYKISKKHFCFEMIEKNYYKSSTVENKMENQLTSNGRKSILNNNEEDNFNNLFHNFLECKEISDVYETIDNVAENIISPDAVDIFMGSMNLGFKIVYSKNKILRKPDLIIRGAISFIITKLDNERKPVIIHDLMSIMNDDDLLKYPGLRNKKTAIFVPMCERNRIVGIIALLFADNIQIDKYQENILICIANMALVTSEKIHYVEEQKDMQTALDRHGKLIAMGRIVAGVAHEVNNPLSIMQLDVDELKMVCERDGIGADTKEIVDSLQEEIERMSTIIKQLKDYSKPEEIVEKESLVDIIELFRTYPVKIFVKNLQKKNIKVSMDFNSEKKLIQIPRNRMIQVIMNLLSNADDAIKNKKDGKIHINISSNKNEKNQQENILIEICDNGVGIKDINMHNIFDPFYTTKIGDGTGLGLSISYSIVKRYKGEIKVKSKEKKGTTFSVIFPAVQNLNNINENNSSQFCFEQ